MATVWYNHKDDGGNGLLINRLNGYGIDVIQKKVEYTDREGILEAARGADAVISAMERWDRDTLAALDNKKTLIIRYGTGIDNIDLAAATELGVPIANCPGANAVPVAEIALLHIMNCMRRFTYSVSGPREGEWPRHFMGNEIDGKTIGLLGFGNIAKHLRRMLSGFDCKVMAYDSFAKPDEEKFNVIAAESPEQIFKECDIISLHIPLNEETKKSINKHYFDLMKPTAYLINTCRGGVIDEADLVEALKAGKLKGAGLDVMTEEPPSPENPLLHMDNVFVSTHLAGCSYEAEDRTQIMLADTINAYLHGEIPFNIMNKQVLQ